MPETIHGISGSITVMLDHPHEYPVSITLKNGRGLETVFATDQQGAEVWEEALTIPEGSPPFEFDQGSSNAQITRIGGLYKIIGIAHSEKESYTPAPTRAWFTSEQAQNIITALQR